MHEVQMKVYGNVQGVGLRYSTREKPRQLSLTGWVKNEPDGSVIILAQGDKENLEKLVQWINTTPMLAQVEKVETNWQNPGEIFTNFEIRY